MVWQLRDLPGPPPGVTQADAEQLFEKGWQYLDEGQLSKAEGVGRKLVAIKFTGGVELIAVVQAERGNLEAAVDTLSSGIALKPVWRLGHLRANYLSDLGRYDEALKAYRDCDGMFGAKPDYTAPNRAIALSRADRDDEARSALEPLLSKDIADDELQAKVWAVARDLDIIPPEAISQSP
jgi:tetratricopeptide (TPR) repeat protein